MSIRDYPGLVTGRKAKLPDTQQAASAVVGKCRPPNTIEKALLTEGVVCEYRFHPTRKWRFDYAFPAHKISLEVEGGVWTQGRHVRGKGFVADIEKYREATILGWRVLRCTSEELNSGEARAIVERAMKEDLEGP